MTRMADSELSVFEIVRFGKEREAAESTPTPSPVTPEED